MNLTHSDKGLETLTLMNTTPEQWALTPIKWVAEQRLVLVERVCPTCDGLRGILKVDGEILPVPPQAAYPQYVEYDETDKEAEARVCAAWEVGHENYRLAREWREAYEAEVKATGACKNFSSNGNCPTCLKTKGWCRGKALVLAEQTVMVGYPQWLPGARFDSRFGANDKGWYCCGLCNKTIKKSHLVPVQAPGAPEKAHAMWVGEDCAKKIFRLSLKKKKDQYLAISFEE